MYTIYALTNPITHEVFYVGMTKDFYGRYMQHLRCDGDNVEKNKIISLLRMMNKVPTLVCLATADTEQEARRLEAYHIEYERLLNQPLVNLVLWTGYTKTPQEEETFKYVSLQMLRKVPAWLETLFGWLTPHVIGTVLYDNLLGKDAQKAKERYRELYRDYDPSMQDVYDYLMGEGDGLPSAEVLEKMRRSKQ